MPRRCTRRRSAELALTALVATAGCAQTELLGLDLQPPEVCSAETGGRVGATATYVPSIDGVLIVGGYRSMRLQNGADLSLPRWVEQVRTDPLSTTIVSELRVGGARADHTATLLQDGLVLVTGGWSLINGRREALRSTFLIDPTDPDRITIRESGVLGAPRAGHRAVALPDGRVLIVGGREFTPDGSSVYPRAIEIYDPNTRTFSTTGQLFQGRYGHSATILDGTEVLVAGGYDEEGPRADAVVIRDGRVVDAMDIPLDVGPVFHAAARNGGELLFAGGSFDVEGRDVSDAVAILGRGTTAQMATPRTRHTIASVGGRLVVIGGASDAEALGTAEWVSDTAVTSAALCTGPRVNHATAATNDAVVIVGGTSGGDPFEGLVDSLEVLRP